MRGQEGDFPAVDAAIWATIGIAAVLVLAATAVSDFRLVWSSHLGVAGALGVLAVGRVVYGRWRHDPRLAAGLGATAQVVAFSAVAAPLSYIAAGISGQLGLPLQDPWFAAADRVVGLDWRALLGWMNALGDVHAVFYWIYLSLMPQTVLVVVALAFSGQFAWLRVFILSGIFATVATIVIAALVPAEGAWGFFAVGSNDHALIVPATREKHLAIFHGLRDGSFRLLSANSYEGIITFPSLHAALAVLLAVGLWPLRILRWFAVALNALMLVSIPIDGGHYFVDVLAGLAVAYVSLLCARAVVARRNRQPVPAVALTSGAPLPAG
jgi:membrane-associated phospholipid phosphatase